MYETRPLAGLASILLLAAVLGAFATLGFSNTDLANSITKSAEARAKDQQTRIDTEKAAIELELYRQISQVELERIQIDKEKQRKHAEINLAQMQDKYQIDVEQYRIRAQQDLELERFTRLSILGVLTLLTVILIIVLGYHLLRREQLRSIISKVTQTHPGKPTIDPWQSNPEWKRQQIRRARQREQELRIAASMQKVRISRFADTNSSSTL